MDLLTTLSPSSDGPSGGTVAGRAEDRQRLAVFALDEELPFSAPRHAASNTQLASRPNVDSRGPTDLRSHRDRDLRPRAPEVSPQQRDRASSRARTGILGHSDRRTEHARLQRHLVYLPERHERECPTRPACLGNTSKVELELV